MTMESDLPDLPSAPARVQTRSFATGRVVLALILREMTTKYGRSPGGYAWAILEPLGMILILSVGFSLLMRSPSLGSSFILFFTTGYMPFNIYQSVASMVLRSINFSKPLLMYPSVTWMDAVLARFVLNTLTGILVSYIIIGGIIQVVDVSVVLDFGPILQAMALAAILGLGVGSLNCVLIGLFPTWEQIWSIITRPLFLASAVIYIFEDLSRTAQEILWYNPVAHITGLMRTGFYPMYSPKHISPEYVIACALISMSLGFILLHRYHKDILND